MVFPFVPTSFHLLCVDVLSTVSPASASHGNARLLPPPPILPAGESPPAPSSVFFPTLISFGSSESPASHSLIAVGAVSSLKSARQQAQDSSGGKPTIFAAIYPPHPLCLCVTVLAAVI